jgi:hypothetical protein
MYLLDEKKTIIAKHILTDQIPEIIERRETPTPSSGS